MAKRNILVFYSNTNTHGKKDATGAFIPEAKAFVKTHSVPVDNIFPMNLNKVPTKERRLKVIRALNNYKGPKLNAIAFFGHGWPSGIQFGFRKHQISLLVTNFKNICKPSVNILLYACLAAENKVKDSNIKNVGPGTDGGFADLLRDEMVRQGMNRGWVDAHKTAGHTTWNPFVVRFYCKNVDDPKVGAVGGSWLVQPRSQFWKLWIIELRNKKRGMRYLFPFMEELELKAKLAGKKIIHYDFTK
jgi:hypothetical protein